jgi:nitrogen-specific signal transduction histidine kinase
MGQHSNLVAARGLTDDHDRLLTADAALSQLQKRCGGLVPGVLAVPELLELVQQARRIGLRIAREFSSFDGEAVISGFVRVHPLGEAAGGGCEVLVESWQTRAASFANGDDIAEQLDSIDRATAEIAARLDRNQRIQVLNVMAADGAEFQEIASANPSPVWTQLVELIDLSHQQPLHWRLLDGAHCHISGSGRRWRIRLIPAGVSVDRMPNGFELLLIADEPLPMCPVADTGDDGEASVPPTRLIGSTLTPALRQPIARIIANAETIRTRLAGPLQDDYSDYAGTIASAGQHLSAMLDDLADLEVVEAPGFSTTREKVDLCDAARRAAGILGVRAHARSITLLVDGQPGAVTAIAEFRRVLQILINLIGNAIAYSPEGSEVQIIARMSDEIRACIAVSDQGQGIAAGQAARIFDKFERLGRDSNGGSDSGSGLGLYISRRLAEAMDGTLNVENTRAGGACFTLELPRA